MLSFSSTTIPAAEQPVAGRRPWVEQVLLAGYALMTAIFLTALLYRATLYVSHNANEGWNAAHATAFFNGQPLYHTTGALLTNNYPPLSFILTALLLPVVPDAVFAGRLLAVAAFLVVAVLIFLILRSARCDRAAAFLGSLVFVACMAVNFPNYVGTDDPQMLAHAVLLTGLRLLVPFPRRPTSIVAAAALMTAGLFIKHNPIAVPVTSAIWLCLFFPAAGARFLFSGLLFGLTGIGICRMGFGSDFLTSMMAPREYWFGKSWRDTLSLPPGLPFFVYAGTFSALLDRRNPFAVFLGLYLIVAVLVGVVAACGVGVSENAFFDVVIGGSLASGHLLAQTRRMAAWPGLRIWALCSLASAAVVGPGMVTAKDMLQFPAWAANERQRSREAIAVVAVLAAQTGPVICETAVFCFWAGKGVELDRFNFAQAVRKGAATDAPVIARLNRTAYAAVARDVPEKPGGLTPGMLDAIAAHYVRLPVATGTQAIYVPLPGLPR